jgi:tripartite-type tricarboxylate transporter receptor subunit TctC
MFALLIGAPAGLRAQTYPSQPIRLIVPFAPGGGMETAVRHVTQRMGDSGWPQFVIDNRPGGAGTIATLATKSAAPDGYTLMLAALSTHAINVALLPDLKYDPVRDFTPITLLFSYPSVVAVPAASPARTFNDLIDMARSRPGGISYGSPGTGTVAHVLALMLESATRTRMVHVPSRGGGPALIDLLAGRVDFMILNPSGITPNVEAGQLRLLAVTAKTRFPELPDVPTLAELGLPEVFLDGWFGVVGPARMPARIVDTLHHKFAAILTAPELNRRLKDQGWVIDPITPDRFGDLIRNDIARLSTILKNTRAATTGAD